MGAFTFSAERHKNENYTPLGYNFLKNQLKKGLRNLLDGYNKSSGENSQGGLVSVDKGPVYQYKAEGVDSVKVKDVTQKPVARMLKGGSPALLGQGINSITKTDKPALPPGGPRLPGSPEKGGGFVNIPGVSAPAAPLNADTFFKRAVTGTGDDGGYLSVEERKSLFAKSKEMRADRSNVPGLGNESGVDVVSAVNKVTEAIIKLSSVTQSSSTENVKGLARIRAAVEEADIEQKENLAGTLTPENHRKKQEQKEKERDKKNKDCSCPVTPFIKPPSTPGSKPAPIFGGAPGGQTGGFGISLPTSDPFEQWRSMPGTRRLETAGRNLLDETLQRGGGRGNSNLARSFAAGAKKDLAGDVAKRGLGALSKPAQKGVAKGMEKGLAKGVGKLGLKKIPGVGAIAGTGFAIERLLKGDILGAAGEFASGIASTVPGIGTGISLGIDAALMGSDAMGMTGGGAGTVPVDGQFATGGIITQPTTALMGEGGKAEGVFPLEGNEGAKTFEKFGKGLLEAQKDNPDLAARSDAKGLGEFFDKQRGFERLVDLMKEKGIGGGGNGEDQPGTGEPGTGGGDFSGSDGQEQAMNYFMSQGLSKEQAAGIVGNLMQESGTGLDPNAKNASGHRGIAQWDANRWGQFEKFAKQKGLDVNTREAQLQWIMEEMRTGSGGLGIERFKKTKNATEAAGLFLSDFERSGETAGSAGYENRMKNARALASRSNFGSTATGGGAGGGVSSNALAQAAQSIKGMDTSKGPDGGNNACVWSVNQVYKKAGIRPPWGDALRVSNAEAAMKQNGYFQVPENERRPGDIYIARDNHPSEPQTHIGVVVGNGNILSNSSSKAKFAWEGPPSQYEQEYGRKGVFYRMPGMQGRDSRLAGKPGSRGGAPLPPARSPNASPAAVAAAPPPGNGLANASAQYTAMGLTTGGGGGNNIYNIAAGGGARGSSGASNQYPTGVSAASVSPWWTQVLPARL